MKWLSDDIEIKVDPKELPAATLISLDLEYSEDGNQLVCIGLFDGVNYYGFVNDFPRVIDYLRTVNWLVHDGIHAELPVLNKLYGGFRPEQIIYDTKVMGYGFDSTLKDWSLKKLVKKYLGAEYPTYQELKKQYKFKNIAELDRDVLINYNAADCHYTYKLWEYYRKHFNTRHWQFYNNIELPTNHLIYKMEQKGIKVDTRTVRRIHNENSKKRRQAKRELLLLAGTKFNPNSPKQLLPLLAAQGINTKSTSEDSLKRFKTVPFVSKLLEYRKYQKITSTYTIPIYTEAIKAVDQRIHSRFTQSTITGRLASSDPINLQNQPTAIRECFVAEAGKAFVGSDWTNVELYLPAHFSGEPGFIEEFSRPDGNIHKRTAKLIYGKEVDKESEEYKKAKTVDFLLTNSGSAKRLATELNCSQKESEAIYKKFWEGYPVLKAWIQHTKRQARSEMGVQTMFGRWVNLAQLSLWCGSANCPVFGPTGYFCKECFIREETEREAVSIRVQGSAADLCKLAALRLYREHGIVPTLLVHDEIVVEVEEEKAEETAKIVQHVMENLVDLRVNLKAKPKIGKTWLSLK